MPEPGKHKRLIAAAKAFATREMKDVPAHHGLPHVAEVEKWALEIGEAEGLGEDEMSLLIIACRLHDIGRGPELAGGIHEAQTNHATTSVEMVRPFLEEQKVDVADVETIVTAIAEHSNKEASSTAIGRILQDADKISCFGLSGFVRIAQHWAPGLDLNFVFLAMVEGNRDKLRGIPDLAKLIRGLRMVMRWYDMLNTASAKPIGLEQFLVLEGLYRLLISLSPADVQFP